MKGLKILLTGPIAQTVGQGGATWAILHYLLGLGRLGHEVWFVEPAQANPTLEVTKSRLYFLNTMEEFGVQERSALIDFRAGISCGFTIGRFKELAREIDLLLNIAGLLKVDDDLLRIPIRVYLDIDPGFTQIWSDAEGLELGFQGHTAYATIGVNIGEDDCPVPHLGLPWVKTLQPIVLEHWEPHTDPSLKEITTVANWRSYGSVKYKNQFYGQKAHSWRRLIDLPIRTGRPFKAALSIDPSERDDLQLLRSNGWQLTDPLLAAGTPDRFRQFVRLSRAELAVAKSGYVEGRTGWFSERSAAYLAAGKPVVAQDTGFGAFLPCGHGLFPFREVDDVVWAVSQIDSDYHAASSSARGIAEEYFDSDRVLKALLKQLGVVM